MKKTVLALAFLTLATPAFAGKYDGSWVVTIRTDRGSCDQIAYGYIDVVGDTVHIHGVSSNQTRNAAGLVDPNGRINVTAGSASDPVAVRGRLGARTGNGVWSAPTRGCSGAWSSARR